MTFELFLERGDFRGERDVVSRDLVGAVRRGRGVAGLAGEHHDDPGRHERGDQPSDAPAGDSGDRQAREVDDTGLVVDCRLDAAGGRLVGVGRGFVLRVLRLGRGPGRDHVPTTVPARS